MKKELKNFIIESDIQLDYFEEVVKHIERKRWLYGKSDFGMWQNM